ncbi:hypothetical protein FFLO_05034 [Filobasidium floriforme]|uniref:Uncharacterized protein n=1 Tax=Filobasidium floriforme TaxID=5210 RepID=A0A8K0JHR1_9TREE|nr:uncharacterized protein HD553DRAFT_345934 [Filobasidium floriforme]KAG7530435.1 hypothetical protein FFLO_05034 [Filobasidium floriforme]KAH8078562.1 hypothetical protein HD553DRAFT_345934 [Filobasidium floriforme]
MAPTSTIEQGTIAESIEQDYHKMFSDTTGIGLDLTACTQGSLSNRTAATFMESNTSVETEGTDVKPPLSPAFNTKDDPFLLLAKRVGSELLRKDMTQKWTNVCHSLHTLYLEFLAADRVSCPEKDFETACFLSQSLTGTFRAGKGWVSVYFGMTISNDRKVDNKFNFPLTAYLREPASVSDPTYQYLEAELKLTHEEIDDKALGKDHAQLNGLPKNLQECVNKVNSDWKVCSGNHTYSTGQGNAAWLVTVYDKGWNGTIYRVYGLIRDTSLFTTG